MCMYVVCMVITYCKSNQPVKVANTARGQLNREDEYSPLSLFAHDNLVAQHGFDSPVPRQPVHLHTQAEYGTLLTVPLPISAAAAIYLFKPPYAIGSVPSLSVEYRWRSLPRVRRLRASKPQDSSSNGCCLCIIVDQSLCASLSYTHYWYKVGTLKVSAGCGID